MNEAINEAGNKVYGATSTTGLIISLIVYILLVVAMWKIYEKAHEPGWLSIIPIVNLYMLFKIACGKGWLCLFMFIPLANLIADVIINWKLVKAFGKGVGTFLLAIFLPPVALLMLGFGDAKYLGPQ